MSEITKRLTHDYKSASQNSNQSSSEYEDAMQACCALGCAMGIQKFYSQVILAVREAEPVTAVECRV